MFHVDQSEMPIPIRKKSQERRRRAADHHRKVRQEMKKHRESLEMDEDGYLRKKRYISHRRSVEVMVTADNAMHRSHDDVEHYILTLMAIVSN